MILFLKSPRGYDLWLHPYVGQMRDVFSFSRHHIYYIQEYLVAIAGTTILEPYHVITSQWQIWRLASHRSIDEPSSNELQWFNEKIEQQHSSTSNVHQGEVP